MTILIINGPNLNRLGSREVTIYGKETYDDLVATLKDTAKTLDLEIVVEQTNFEGIILDLMHYSEQVYDAIVINAAALSHYSYAIYDAIKSIDIPVINVHLTDPTKRTESFRHTDVIEPACLKTFKGKGFKSYTEALTYLKKDVLK